MTIIGEAAVKITADASKFGGQVKGDVDKAMNETAALASTHGGRIGSEISGGMLGRLRGGWGEMKGGFGEAFEHVKGQSGSLVSEFTGNLGPGFGKVSELATGTKEAMGGAALGMGVAALGAAGLGVGIAKMAISGIGDFTKLAAEVRGFQRLSGQSAEESSKWVAAAKAMNVPVDALSTAMFRLSQNVEKHAGQLAADGIAIARDKAGHVDLTGTLLNVSEAYRNNEDAASRNKVVMDAFGRSGATLIPILKAGKEQLDEFFRAAEIHHEILSQSDLDKAKEMRLAVHDLSEAWGGMERELGQLLVPVVSKVATLTTHMIEGFDMTVNAVGHVSSSLVSGAEHLFGFGKAHKDATDRVHEASVAVSDETKVLDALAKQGGVTSGRMAQLAAAQGIDLASATDKVKTKLVEAAQKLNDAITPTQHLTADTFALSNAESTAAESVKAYKDALASTLGVHMDVIQAGISLRKGIQGLADDMRQGQQKGESYAAFQDRIAGSLSEVVNQVDKNRDALTRQGKLAVDATTQNAFMADSLRAIAERFPPLRGQVQLYLADLSLIPGTKTTVFTADVTSALANMKVLVQGMGEVSQSTKDIYTAGHVGVLAPGVVAALDKATGKIKEQAGKTGASAGASMIDALVKEAEGNLSKVTGAANKVGSTAAKAVEHTLLASAGPGGGLDIGGFIVKGIQAGAAENQVKANNATSALVAGMKEIVDKAKVIDPNEALGILEAIKNVREATNQLATDRKKLGVGSIEAAIDEQKLKIAQGEVNSKYLDAISASKAVTEATKKQKDAQALLTAELGRTFSGLSAILSVTDAKSGIVKAQKDLDDARARQVKLPIEIAAAEARVTKAKLDGAAVTATEAKAIVDARIAATTAEKDYKDALHDTSLSKDELEQKRLASIVAEEDYRRTIASSTAATDDLASATSDLAQLQEEQTGIAGKVEEATLGVTRAQLGAIQAEADLVQKQKDLIGLGPEVLSFFTNMAAAVGIPKGVIDGLIASISGLATGIGNIPIPGMAGGVQLPGGGALGGSSGTYNGAPIVDLGGGVYSVPGGPNLEFRRGSGPTSTGNGQAISPNGVPYYTSPWYTTPNVGASDADIARQMLILNGGYPYDDGGWLPPTGAGGAVYKNLTGKPEAVFTQDQLGRLGTTIHVEIKQTNSFSGTTEALAASIDVANERLLRALETEMGAGFAPTAS